MAGGYTTQFLDPDGKDMDERYRDHSVKKHGPRRKSHAKAPQHLRPRPQAPAIKPKMPGKKIKVADLKKPKAKAKPSAAFKREKIKDAAELKMKQEHEKLYTAQDLRKIREGVYYRADEANAKWAAAMGGISSGLQALPGQMKSVFGKKFNSKMMAELRRRMTQLENIALESTEDA